MALVGLGRTYSGLIQVGGESEGNRFREIDFDLSMITDLKVNVFQT